jgi:CRISPR-associated endonuclease/helicase Cas3
MSQRNEEYQRYEFIYEMERLYLQEAFSDEAMGERLGTDRSNVWRIRRMMTEKMGIPIDPHPTERGKWYIHPDYSITHIPFSREQMAALYLAARRLQQQTRSSQQPVVDVLEKLAHALHQPLAEGLVKAAKQVLEQEQDPQQQRVFADLVQCWLNRTPARITHRKLHGEARVYRVYPYQIEPAVWGDGNYLIGFSEYHNKIATFKLSRIEKVVIGTGKFEMPANFNVHDLLKYAWGVWHADEEPITVKLRFSKWAIPRLRESIWHPTAVLHDPDSEGNCEWEVQVAEWREMFPWVKGWGSNVTILEPSDMVEEMKREVRRLVRKYAITELPDPPTYQLLWAKTGSNDSTHPLICHMIDVGQVALALWNQVLTDGLRQQIADTLQLPIEATGKLVAFWASLHDLGKACPAFQAKYKPAEPILTKAGFLFPNNAFKDSVYHATITTCTLDQLLVDQTGIDRQLAKKIGQALGGHHGFWPTTTELKAQRTKPDMIGSGLWHDARQQIVSVLHDLFAPLAIPGMDSSTIDQSTLNALLTLFSGITSLADWIGSMDTYFTFEEAPLNPQTYSQISAERAQKALEKLGLASWQLTYRQMDFGTMFNVSAPRPMQQAVIELSERLTQPSLVIIEAPTGTGKTEAAFYLADVWLQKFQQRGLYVAMPTMATSNQMHDRTTEFLKRRYPEQRVEPLLIHSQARWLEHEPPDLTLMDERAKANASVVDMSWFLPRKRSLLAPFAVGTVDQALLSVLQTRHFFIRLLGLSHKTIIFDEVHAYDAYMSQLFQQLLRWLRSIGASVVLLSATLPKQTREKFLQAYTGTERLQLPEVKYPAISWASGEQCGVVPLSHHDSRTLQLGWIDRSVTAVVNAASEAIQDSGCIAIICNTVARAQAIHAELAKQANLLPDPDENLILFHARSPFAWRDATEKKVLRLFGKPKQGDEGVRPQKAIVVATQVIEQSLDLDFDLIISDLAPVDLLLQRAGRLHRHEGRIRPQCLQQAQLWLTFTPTAENLPEFEDDDAIYEPYVLLRSYLVLGGRSDLMLPEQTPYLIEAVYGDQPAEAIMSIPALPSIMVSELTKAQEKMESHLDKACREADQRLVASPDYESLLTQRSEDLEEDNPAVHKAYQAMTRLGPQTIALVCLHRTASGLNTEPDGSGTTIQSNEKPDTFTTKQLARYTVTIHHRGIVNFFTDSANASYMPTAWKDHALLRDHYLVVFTNNHFQLVGTPYHLYLTRTYGLEIKKEAV